MLWFDSEAENFSSILVMVRCFKKRNSQLAMYLLVTPNFINNNRGSAIEKISSNPLLAQKTSNLQFRPNNLVKGKYQDVNKDIGYILIFIDTINQYLLFVVSTFWLYITKYLSHSYFLPHDFCFIKKLYLF
jgi:hypothetical protein